MHERIGYLVVVGALLWPAWSFACLFVCGDSTKISAGEIGMPANTPSLFFDLDRASPSDSPITLKEEGGPEIPFTMEGCCQLTPHAPFEPNTTYVVGRNVEALGINCRNPLELTFKTGAVEPLPESMGELSIGELKLEVISLDDSDGCLSPAEVVYVDVELALSEDAKRWQGGLFINTQVDGEPHNESQRHRATFKPGETWMGYGRDRVFVICEERRAQGGEQRFQEGSHEIQMVGTIPGTEVQIESNTVTVDLYCNPPAPAEEESGCSAAGGAPFALSLLILGALRRRKPE